MHMRIALAVLLLCMPAGAQSSWEKEEKSDPLRGTQYLQFSLRGKYLAAPKRSDPNAAPVLIARCTPGSFAHGTARGKFLSGYVFIGSVVDTQIGSAGSPTVHIQFRLDGGKLQDAYWSHSTDFSSVFFGELDFNNLLFGHLLPHKENTNPQVRKVVLGLPEFMAGEVVAEFEFPESTDVADACGVIWHKERK
jgi:hypothetical protein